MNSISRHVKFAVVFLEHTAPSKLSLPLAVPFKITKENILVETYLEKIFFSSEELTTCTE
jgi:hypothetical protein